MAVFGSGSLCRRLQSPDILMDRASMEKHGCTRESLVPLSAVAGEEPGSLDQINKYFTICQMPIDPPVLEHGTREYAGGSHEG